ncbi:uncharacterized protein LOC133728928 [Rosa rugosa]|uniref:uncharacterized protein LOC133728928 n=1 Tax=Rosa rugosa TaxID=74645 RepID=UPI002B407230|nr:uncharacterized protein LOC133728928 [Rosa rugosa]
MEGVVRFGKKGKLSPRFVGPFEILERVGDLAYRLALPPSMSGVHNVFHVSMLRKSTKQLRRMEVDLVKVLWSHHDKGDASWELESDMRAKYPQLFVDEQA